VRFTPKGFFVMVRHRRISLRRSSGVGCVSAVNWKSGQIHEPRGYWAEAYYSQATGIADGAGKLSVAYPLHATLHNGHFQSPLASYDRVGAGDYIPLMPSARVSSVVKGMLNR
jgi:hypothetical protein